MKNGDEIFYKTCVEVINKAMVKHRVIGHLIDVITKL